MATNPFNRDYFLGPGVGEFPVNLELPTQLETLKFCANLYFANNLSKRECAIRTARELVEIWAQRNIEPQQMYRAADKVQILFQKYYEMWRKRNNGGVRLQQRRNAFVQNMEGLFDISRQPIVRGADEIENERADEHMARQAEINVPLVYAERQPNQNLIVPVEPLIEVEEVHNA